jgi:hypothetical protein
MWPATTSPPTPGRHCQAGTLSRHSWCITASCMNTTSRIRRLRPIRSPLPNGPAQHGSPSEIWKLRYRARWRASAGMLYAFGDISTANGTPINSHRQMEWHDMERRRCRHHAQCTDSSCAIHVPGGQPALRFHGRFNVHSDLGAILTSHILQWNGSAWVTHTSNINTSVILHDRHGQ